MTGLATLAKLDGVPLHRLSVLRVVVDVNHSGRALRGAAWRLPRLLAWSDVRLWVARQLQGKGMIRFNVVKDQYGWTVRMEDRMTTPFWSKDVAIRQANRLAAAIRRHGEGTEVIVEGADSEEPATRLEETRSFQPDGLVRRRQLDPQ